MKSWVSNGNGARWSGGKAPNVNGAFRAACGNAPWVGALAASSRASVSSGNINFTTETEKTISVPSLIMNKTLLLFSVSSNVNTDNSMNWLFTGRIKNNTTLEFKRSSAGYSLPCFIHWFLVEFESSVPITIQHSNEITLTSISQNETISSIDLSHSFPILSVRDNKGALYASSSLSADLTSTTNLQIESSNVDTQVFTYQVIENLNWDVQKKYISDPIGTAIPIDTTISTINKNHSFCVFNGKYLDGAYAGIRSETLAQIEISDNNTVSINRNLASNYTGWSFIAYVIDSNEEISVEHVDENLLGSSGSISITEIELDQSVIHCSCQMTSIVGGTGAGAWASNILVKQSFTDNTTLFIERGSTYNTSFINTEILNFNNV